jgi:hypothetical protein
VQISPDATPTALKVYPNPVRKGETLKVVLPAPGITATDPKSAVEAGTDVSVYNINGKEVLRQKAKGPTVALNLKGPAGIYIIRANGQTTKFVIE